MRTSNNSPISLLSLIFFVFTLNLSHAQDIEQWEEQDTTLVGRISHLEGQLSRYNPDTDDWEITTTDAPFGLDDLLYAETDVKAEFIMPNNTWIRIGGDTRLQLVTLDPKTTEVDIAFGKARLFNKSSKNRIIATTPFGLITAPPGSTIDLFIKEDGAEIVALKKKAFFVHNASSTKHEIRSDSSALLANINEVTAAPGKVEYGWKIWNQEMDAMWTTRMRDKGTSVAHLPSELHTEAYPLDQHGIWEKVYYEGTHYRFWRPTHVSAAWAPFTSGAWTVWHGEHVWIPHEPFGYVTHHYGNWIFTAGFWYWAPPVTRVMIHAHVPRLRIGFGWYPGRVAWIHHGAHLGWIPLAPHEPYYTHRHWGRRSIVVTSGTHYHHRPRRYRHAKHAFVIHRSHLYRSGSYRRARIRSISHNTIHKNFKSTPVLNRAVIKDHGSQRRSKNHYRPGHKAHLYKHSVKTLNSKQRERLSKANPRQRSQRHRENVKGQSQRKDIQTGRRSIDRKHTSSGRSKANISETNDKNRPHRKTPTKVRHGSKSGVQTPKQKNAPQQPKAKNIKKHANVTPSKTDQTRPDSGQIAVDRKRTQTKKSEPLEKNRAKVKQHNKKNPNRSPRRDAMRMTPPKSQNLQHHRKNERLQRNGRSKGNQRNSQLAPAQSGKKSTRYQRAANPAKPNKIPRTQTYRRPASSRGDTSVGRIGKQNQPVQRQIRQQNHRSGSRSTGGFTGTRHRQSNPGARRHRNIN